MVQVEAVSTQSQVLSPLPRQYGCQPFFPKEAHGLILTGSPNIS